jgi:Protein of unknown function (DUF3562)
MSTSRGTNNGPHARTEVPVVTDQIDQNDALDPHVLRRTDDAMLEGTAMGRRETADRVRVERKLMAEFGQALGPETVMRSIADAVARFAGARVRTYVMLLVEREATEELRARARLIEP